LGAKIEVESGEGQHKNFSLNKQNEFLNVPASRPFGARGLSSPILQERVLIARSAILILGRKLRPSGAENFHHAGLRRERG